MHAIAELAESVELFGEEFLARVFTSLEREQCAGPAALDRLAARLAAKGAVLRVLQLPATAGVPWKAVEVRTGRNRVPYVVLDARAAALAEAQGIQRIHISVSHDAGIAMAVAAAIPVENQMALTAAPGRVNPPLNPAQPQSITIEVGTTGPAIP